MHGVRLKSECTILSSCAPIKASRSPWRYKRRVQTMYVTRWWFYSRELSCAIDAALCQTPSNQLTRRSLT
eukprot:COSAG02_NODE_273_length_26316_cov_13.661060_8_plen_70_part_00